MASLPLHDQSKRASTTLCPVNELIHPAFTMLPLLADDCHLSVAIPVRNEEAYLWATLHALAHQYTRDGARILPQRYEVVLLLNHCSDGSARIARRFCATYPECVVHVAEWNFPQDMAHVGSARSLLLRQCALRHEIAQTISTRNIHVHRLLLTTDADTIVHRHWIAETLCCVRNGADAVGGDILMCANERRSLPTRARRAYVLDRRYRRAVAQLESLLDPLPHDPWPRHQHHFGGSMACTLQAYRRSGGMQPMPTLEDLSFYHALVSSGARFRHEPRVRVYTSARISGRVAIGLSEQLSQWTRRGKLTVPSTELLVATFTARAMLRHLVAVKAPTRAEVSRCADFLHVTAATLRNVLAAESTCEGAWNAIGGNAGLCASFPARAHCCPMVAELRNLQRLTAQLRRCVAADPCGSSHVGVLQSAATMAG